MKHLFAPKTLCLLVLAMTAFQPLRAQWLSAPTPKREYRAVWLTTIKNLDWPSTPATTPSGEERQRAELCAILDTLHAVGINTVLMQTRLRGDVIYPSMREPFSAFITGKEGQRTTTYDPLQFVIDECHRRGMQCHAWIVALQVKDNKYVDPAEPAVVSHLCDMVREVVRGYDVDGIHLDYLRYPEKTKGRDQWRRDNVTACLRAVYRTVKAEKPWLCVSAAPLGKYRNTARASSQGWNAYHTVFQEAQEWLREGICDALFPMMYYDGPHFYPFVSDWAAHTYGRHFAAGLGIYQLDPAQLNWDISTIRSQISFVRSFAHDGACGYALFRAGFIMNDTKGIRRELRHLNASPALVPALADESHGRPDSPSAVTFTLIGDSIRISWAAPFPSGEVRGEAPIRYNLYRSVGTAIDTTVGSHLYLTYLSGTTVTVPRTTRTASASYALTAIDCYGRESRPVVWNMNKTANSLSPLSARR
ncbi:MAG: family 10 glycosylhydrolase [Bacteroidaceae bacterium]|nr:family 10 glycosylhydrolase [Bacteroidaceae bacterium]MBR4778646.1 family 10 glycosylhydrolase [Bacteroidaceae bacterium]